MAKDYRQSNIRFNMDNYKQKYAWEYLQKNRGIMSYAEAIAEAIYGYTKNPSKEQVSIDDDSVRRISASIQKMISNQEVYVSNYDNNTDMISDEMLSFALGC